MTASGWLYVALRKPFFGIIHTFLLFCAAGFGVYCGLPSLIAHSYPVESLAALAFLAYTAIGILFFVCAVGMLWNLRVAKKMGERRGDTGC